MRVLLRCTLIATLLLSGCATQAEKQAAADHHYEAQKEFVTASAAAQRPIFELEGVDGQTINLSGVRALRVFGPNNQQAQFQAAPVEPSPWIESLKIAKELTLGIAPIYLGGKVLGTMNKMSDNIASGRGPVTTTTATTTTNTSTTSNANQQNTTTTSNANQQNTTTQTLGSNSVLGSGTSSNPVTTSTNTSSSNTTTTNTTSTNNTPTTTTSTTTNSNHGTCTTGTC